MARIVVCGYMLRHPVAGNLLAYFQYVMGFARLGHDVTYLEESGWPYACYDPWTREWQDHPAGGLRIVRELMRAHGLSSPVCFVNRETGAIDGLTRDELQRTLRDADLLLNIGGVCWLDDFRLCPRRAIVDMDPLFTQVGQFGGKVLGDYHVHFSYGTNIGRPGCSIPTAGVTWLPAVPPVVLDLWSDPPRSHRRPPARAARSVFTTIANWGAYGGVDYGGEHYGQKDEEFLKLLDLPHRTTQPLELALSGADASLQQRLRDAGWLLRDAAEVSTDMQDYLSYIVSSRGEFSAAKNAYVKTRSGWFSDRTACYLAAGLPVVVQDTGAGDSLPIGNGLLTFSSPEQATACLERVNADYEEHRRAAREVAREFFSADVVLPRLLQTALEAPASPSHR